MLEILNKDEPLLNRLRRYSMACITYKLDGDFASAVYEAADIINSLVDDLDALQIVTE